MTIRFLVFTITLAIFLATPGEILGADGNLCGYCSEDEVEQSVVHRFYFIGGDGRRQCMQDDNLHVSGGEDHSHCHNTWIAGWCGGPVHPECTTKPPWEQLVADIRAIQRLAAAQPGADAAPLHLLLARVAAAASVRPSGLIEARSCDGHVVARWRLPRSVATELATGLQPQASRWRVTRLASALAFVLAPGSFRDRLG